MVRATPIRTCSAANARDTKLPGAQKPTRRQAGSRRDGARHPCVTGSATSSILFSCARLPEQLLLWGSATCVAFLTGSMGTTFLVLFSSDAPCKWRHDRVRGTSCEPRHLHPRAAAGAQKAFEVVRGLARRARRLAHDQAGRPQGHHWTE